MIHPPRTALLDRPDRTGAPRCWSPLPLRGMSLIEVLIALVLGLFLLAGIIQVLISARAAYRLAEAQVRTQENGRFAMQYLTRELRPSRSGACRNIAHDEIEQSLNVLACSLLTTPATCTGKAKIGTKVPLGYSPSATPGNATNALAGLPEAAKTAVGKRWLRGDVLVSWGTFGEGIYTQIRAAKDRAALQLLLYQPIAFIDGTKTADLESAGIKAGALAVSTDCETTDLFVVSNDFNDDDTGYGSGEDAPKLPLSSDLNGPLAPLQATTLGGSSKSPIRARVFPFDFRVYFICCVDKQYGNHQFGSDVDNCTTDPATYRPSLCRWSASAGDTQSLTMDVADMRITYDGQDGDTRFSEPASTVTTSKLWDRVNSARIELLVTSDDEVRTTNALPSLAAPNSTRGLGQGLDSDRRLYETFNATVAIRSRAPWYASP